MLKGRSEVAHLDSESAALGPREAGEAVVHDDHPAFAVVLAAGACLCCGHAHEASRALEGGKPGHLAQEHQRSRHQIGFTSSRIAVPEPHLIVMVFYPAVTVAQVVVSLTVLVVVAKNRGVRRRREAKNGIVVEAGRVVVEHVAQQWHGRCGGDSGLLRGQRPLDALRNHALLLHGLGLTV